MSDVTAIVDGGTTISPVFNMYDFDEPRSFVTPVKARMIMAKDIESVGERFAQLNATLKQRAGADAIDERSAGAGTAATARKQPNPGCRPV